MKRFSVFVIALVLAPGLQAAAVSNQVVQDFNNLPSVIVPGFIRPLPQPLPEGIPEPQPVVPGPIDVNPCNACFEYMTSLIDQLTEVADPETVPVRPLPEQLPQPEAPEVEIKPIPLPVRPEIEIRPRPLPSVQLY